MKNRIYIAFFSLALAACSSDTVPSQSDIESNIEDWMPDCDFLSIRNVEKINGRPLQDGYYVVETSFEINLSPIKENQQIAEEYRKFLGIKNEIEAKEKTEQQALDEEEKQTINKYEDDIKIINSNGKSYDERYEERSALIEEKYSVETEFRNKRRELHSKFDAIRGEAGLNVFDKFSRNAANAWRASDHQLSNLNRECPQKSSMYTRLLGQIITGNSKEKLIDLLDEGGSVPFSYELNMIKTERGWQFAE